MKILIVVHYYLPHIGGMENVVAKQAESLTKMGHEVTILTCRSSKGLPLSEDGKYKVIRLRSLNFVENKFGVTYPLISPLNFFKLLKLVGSHDVVHVHDVFYMSSHISGFAAIARKKPLFITQHVALVDHPNHTVMWIQRLIHRSIGKYLFKRARAIVVYNTNVKDFLVALGVKQDKLFLNYNGIDTEMFSPISKTGKDKLRLKYNLPLNKPVILFVGRLVPKKGFDLVFEARSNAYTTVIVGNGTIPKRMKHDSNVIFFGPATQAQAADLYKLSDLFVFPAVGEIFTLVMQEAMACGLPLITSDDSGYARYGLSRELIGFTKRESKSVKSTIEQLLANGPLKDRMGHYSRQFAVQNFSWQKNYQHELKIYKKLAESL